MALTVPEAVDALGEECSVLVRSRTRSQAAIVDVVTRVEDLQDGALGDSGCQDREDGAAEVSGTRILLTSSAAELDAAIDVCGSARALRAAGVRAVVVCDADSDRAVPDRVTPDRTLPDRSVLSHTLPDRPVPDRSVLTQLSQRDISVLRFAGARDAAAARLYRALAARASAEAEQLALTRRLLAAADSDDPLASLVQAMAELCSGSAFVFDDSLTLLHGCGAGPAQLIAGRLAPMGGSAPTSHAPTGRGSTGRGSTGHAPTVRGPSGGRRPSELNGEPFTIGRWLTAARRIRVRSHDYHLVLASYDHARLRRVTGPVFDTLTAILGSFGAVEGFARTQQTMSSAALLRELELGISVGEEQRCWQKMAEFGFSAYTDLHLVICATTSGAALTRTDIDAVLAPLGVGGAGAQGAAVSGGLPGRLPVLAIESARLGDQEPGMRLLVPAGPVAEAVVTGLQEARGRFAAGMSEPFSQLSALPEIARATETALRIARTSVPREPGGNGSSGAEATTASAAVIRVDELTPLEWLLAGATTVRDRSVLADYAAGLRARPELCETLLAYLRAGQTINRAAAELAIHPNTLRYRIARIEEVLGASISDPLVIANLCLAFHAELPAAHRPGRPSHTRQQD